jgi:hypothetical protein
MADLKEERIWIKFCFNHEKPVSKTYYMLENALCDDATSSTQTSEWYSCSKRGQTSVMDFEWSGHPLLSQRESVSGHP